MTIGNRSKGQIVTFYSYKGGVGRSRALANTAYQLAQYGKSVLCLDFDLEAPGLIGYFEKWDTSSDVKYKNRPGIIDLLYSYKEYLLLRSPLRKILDWKSLIHPITIVNGIGSSRVDIIGPGRQTQDYGSKVAQFDWLAFYDELEGGGFIEHLREQFREAYDYVLIDSRTGLSDIGGICSIQFPTILIIVFTSSPQSLSGLEAIVDDIGTQHRALRKNFVPIIPLPSRIDRKEEKHEYDKWFENVVAGNIGKLLSPFLTGEGVESLLQKITIEYVPWYTYRDELESELESSTDIGANALRYRNLVQLIYEAANLSAENQYQVIAEERIRRKLMEEENRVGFNLENLLDLNPHALEFPRAGAEFKNTLLDLKSVTEKQ
jgi:cellulose biosynthesis protein BcsQ